MRSIALLLLPVAAMPVAAQEPLRMVRIETDRPAVVSRALHDAGIDVEHGHTYSDEDGGGLELIVAAQEQAWLEEQGFGVRLVREGRPLRDRLDALNGGQEGIPSGYADLAGILAQMNAAAARNPSICQVVDLTARYGTPPTHEGRHIHAVRISDNVSTDEAEPAVLIVSAHHSREIGTPIVALRAIDNLVDGYGVDQRVTDAVDDHEIWIAPVWNPDGYEHVYNVDDFWRKNRRDNGDGTRGVDLNRNYPVGWGVCGGSQNTSGQTYEGPSAASEPETQTMLAFAEDRRFARVGDIHSYASEVRYGYGCWAHPWDPHYESIASDLSALSGYFGETGSSCCLGGDIHMHTHQNGALSFLWEIGTSFHPSFASADSEADTIWNAVVELIDRPSAISGRITSAWNGASVEAEIELLAVPFSNGERHRSAPRHGLYHAHPPAGTYMLSISADGFEPAEATVTVSGSTPSAIQDVALVPLCRADTNHDGTVSPQDFNAWVLAFNNQAPACDQNGDGLCSPQDFNAWIANFNAGCP